MLSDDAVAARKRQSGRGAAWADEKRRLPFWTPANGSETQSMPLTTRKKKNAGRGGRVELCEAEPSPREGMELGAGRRFAGNVGEAQVEVDDYSGAKVGGRINVVASVVLQVSDCGEGLLVLVLV